LRELQGLKLLDNVPTLSQEDIKEEKPIDTQTRLEPKFDSENLINPVVDVPQKVEASKGKWTKKPFSREEYLKEIRGSLLGNMVLALFFLIASLIAAFSLYGLLLLPKFEEMQAQATEIAQIPSLSLNLDQQIKNQKQSLEIVQKNLVSLTNYFPSPSQAQVSYAHFLTLLESQKVQVNTQLGGISQTSVHPHLSGDKTNQLIQAAAQAITTAVGKQPEPKKLPPLSADLKPGLNYYHMEFTFEGGYVGYLIARQSLVNDIPNTIIHSESVKSAKTPGLMEIHVFMSIPFISKV
jgi:hypothetical protein